MTKTIRKIVTEQTTKDSHPRYKDFNIKQLVITLAEGEKILLKVIDKSGVEATEYAREFTALHENSQVNVIFQTKGVKNIEPPA